MFHPNTAPLAMSPKVLFAPADGRTYRPEDQDRAFAQQPLEVLAGLPYSVPFLPSQTSNSGHFPQVVHSRCAPATFGLSNEENEHYTKEDWAHERPNIAETIFDYDFIEAIREYLCIGPEGDKLFNIEVLYDSQREGEWGLTIGSNYLKLLKKEYVDKLEALIEPDEPAMWYLHCKKWKWRRAPLRAKSQPNDNESPTKVVTLDKVPQSV